MEPAPRTPTGATDPVAAALGRAVATDHARIMAAVLATVPDWQLAEDALQDACERALEAWSRGGVPTSPAGWLVTAARRRGIDLLRRGQGRAATLQRYGTSVERGMLDTDPEPEVGDDRLRLVLTCAHPALPLEARVALTLRTVLGWTPAEIAAAFLATEAAVQKRLVRARAKIAHAGIPYRVPPPEELPDRVDGVLGVVYVVFTAGYAGTGDAGLMTEAVRLARLVRDLLDPALPERLEASGLLALLLAQRARQDARLDEHGAVVLLDRQDRSRWDHGAIAEAERLVDEVLQLAAHRRQPVGRYTLQAAIALEHVRPATADATDWPRIAQLHALLARLDDGPAQRLARAVADGRAHGPRRGLETLDGVPEGARTYLFHAARADLLEAAGRPDDAREEYGRAAALAPGDLERTALTDRQDALGEGRAVGRRRTRADECGAARGSAPP
ncbi:RNA polymerase sigma factor [Cellulomonas endophytica]|uniref:RNA polymerase sigma factor n=1 Tax=Cellulomonas endophytica TaxID=2494735 RepID=UPI00196B9184|nr:sigma-70 family RNA polymerase sigma factor [Cellulomonas endophytica]